MSRFSLVYVTAPDAARAQALAFSVVEAHLAACANILGAMTSVYRWQGAIETSGEISVLFKTRADLVPALTDHVRARHPYEIPCVVAVPIMGGEPAFLDWIGAETLAAAVPVLTTRRLVLLPLSLADAPAIQAQFPHWEIVRHLAAVVPWPYPPDGALSHLRDRVLPGMRAGTTWSWSIRLKDAPDRIIGQIDLRDGDRDNRGFWLAREHQGRGLMGEAADAVTDFWFTTLRRPALRVPKSVDNEASRRISLRQGMRVIETERRAFVGGEALAELWEITAAEWVQARQSRDQPPRA